MISQRPDALEEIRKILNAPQGAVTPASALGDFPTWDSLALLSFIAMGHARFGRSISTADLGACATVADLCRLLDAPAAR